MLLLLYNSLSALSRMGSDRSKAEIIKWGSGISTGNKIVQSWFIFWEYFQHLTET